jgi:hypothetical protein
LTELYEEEAQLKLQPEAADALEVVQAVIEALNVGLELGRTA